jgi:RNA polymerase sigma factor (sigma-70 family)
MDDRDLSLLLQQARAGSPGAVAGLVEHFTPALMLQAEHRVGAPIRRFVDPADVVDDVWLIALRRLPDFAPEPGRSARTWLAYLSTILLRHVRDLYGKHLAGKPLAESPPTKDSHAAPDWLEAAAAEATGVVTRAARAESGAALREAIRSLDPLDRAVVVLRGIEGLSNEGVAALTGLLPNTVSVRLRRALERLRGRLPPALIADLEGP